MKKYSFSRFLNILIVVVLTLSMAIMLSSCNSAPVSPEETNSSESSTQSSESSFLPSAKSYDTIYSDVAIYNFEAKYLTDAEKEEFVSLCDQGILDIKSYLGDYATKESKIIYYIESDINLASQTFVDGSIELHGVKEKLAEYIHESVHSLVGFHNPIWLDEGLATYLDSKFTIWKNPPAYGEDINQLSHNFLFIDGYMHIERMSDEIMISKDRFRAYVAAASLVEYIEKNFSQETMLKLHNDFNNSDEILGRDFFKVKGEWLDYIEKNY